MAHQAHGDRGRLAAAVSGGVILKLRAKLGRKACCDLGGTPFIDGASNTYRGCMPDSGNEALRRAACG